MGLNRKNQIPFLITILLCVTFFSCSDKSKWAELGASASEEGITRGSHPSLAIGPDGSHFVSYLSGDDSDVFLRTWNGERWLGLGDSARENGISNMGVCANNSVAINPDGLPIAAWGTMSSTGDTFFEDNLFLLKWDGTSWSELGNSGSDGIVDNDYWYSITSSKVVVAADGHLLIAVMMGGFEGEERTLSEIFAGLYEHAFSQEEIDALFEIYTQVIMVFQWNGAEWESVGDRAWSSRELDCEGWDCPGPYPQYDSTMDIALDPDNYPVIAWENKYSWGYEMYLRKWNGNEWTEMEFPCAVSESSTNGILPGPDYNPRNPVLAVDQEGNIFVAWEDYYEENREIFLKYWDGSDWEELGESDTEGGVSDSSGVSTAPSLALDSSGRPYIAWLDNTNGVYEIYLKYWDGEQWAELDGSASNGGVSNTVGRSDNPAVILDSSDVPYIAWREISGGISYIYLRHWNKK